MNGGRLLRRITALAAWLAITGAAAADRTPGVRTAGQRQHGTRPDITVPYLNHGLDAFHANGVAPRIYSSPEVDDPTKNPSPRRVFNLIFYGSREGFGDKSNGARERPGNRLRPPKSQ
jgi:hypothetical protein